MTKPTKWPVRLAKTQISLGIRSVWSESSLSAWRNLGSLATRTAHSEDSDQIERMPRLIASSLGAQLILLVLSCSRIHRMQIFRMMEKVVKPLIRLIFWWIILRIFTGARGEIEYSNVSPGIIGFDCSPGNSQSDTLLYITCVGLILS